MQWQRTVSRTGGSWRGLWGSLMAWCWLAVMPDRAPQGPSTHIHMAVLQAPGETAKPGWIVTVQANGDVVLDPLVPVAATPGRSVELWTLAPN